MDASDRLPLAQRRWTLEDELQVIEGELNGVAPGSAGGVLAAAFVAWPRLSAGRKLPDWLRRYRGGWLDLEIRMLLTGLKLVLACLGDHETAEGVATWLMALAYERPEETKGVARRNLVHAALGWLPVAAG